MDSQGLSGERVAELVREHFEELRDWRRPHGQVHDFFDVLFMALCGAIAGCDGWADLATYAEGKRARFAEWLGWPEDKRAPSAHTFGRILGVLHPRHFEACMRAWVRALAEEVAGEVVALDGKAVRGALQRVKKRRPTSSGLKCLHLLHAYATRQGLLLGQVAVDGAPGEVVALPALIAELDVAGAVLTVDAGGCTAGFAAAAIEAQADYVMCVKGNRGALHRAAMAAFEGRAAYDTHTEVREGHGRRETVRTQVTPVQGPWPLKTGGRWAGAATWVRVERHREGDADRPATLEVHYYLTSLGADAADVAARVRAHWAVETGLHWVLDVAFREDTRRIRSPMGAQNFAALARMALALLKREGHLKRGIEGKRKRAGWDDAYLLKVLCAGILED